MPIRVWNYLNELDAERQEIDRAIDDVLRSGRLILGRYVKQFEERFAAFCGVCHGVGVANGTDALSLALRALGLGPGDEVITVANTAVATVSAVVTAGALPRFVDIDPATYLMDPECVGPALTSKTRCILPVHLFGQCADMSRLLELGSRQGVHVLEDCAQAHGATQGDMRAGSMGELAAFSFYPTKILGGYGDGGMIVTDDGELDERLRRLRFYGMQERDYAVEHGYNSRLDELQAAILLSKLARIETYIERRSEIARRYEEQLGDTELVLPATAPGNEHAYHLFVVRHPERDRILPALRDRGVELGIHYRWPIHCMPAYELYGAGEGSLPHTEQAAREIFSLPMYPSLSDEEQERCCSELRQVLSAL